jgi:hypothetical protein
MDWALQAAHQQHSQAVAEAYAAAEAAQRSGEGPKPMMVTPYKHNWVISGTHPEHDSPEEEKYGSFFLAIHILDSLILTEFWKISVVYGVVEKRHRKPAAPSRRPWGDLVFANRTYHKFTYIHTSTLEFVL